jgi:serine/threonine protein kinase/tetratricopeptide (TPR) repeat protein
MDSIPQPTTPAYIGHYHLLEPIGRGGMGLVFRARDTRLEREVAIKCLRTELFEAHYIERFKREALLLAKLNHPNIVQIYDFIEAPDQLALVMELVDGQNLQTYLREHIVPMSQRLHWLTQIAEGLAIAHDAGIIHRDLKAENILINKRGQSKITDLGIAKSQDFNATLTDHVAGSYCSMSPEQAMGEDISFKSDLFSLGILAYQLLCGAHPFGDTGNKLQIMQRIISHPPTPPHQHNPDLPAEFVDLLGQLLSKDPNKRPDNTHWVAAQFKKLSTMNVHDNIASDDTQALAIPQPNIARSARTQDHPTFETRFVAVAAPKISLWKKLKDYIAANKIIVGSAALSVLMITGVIVWQLQPKPPKYVAVIPPKLTAEGMQESQQELVKGAVYDAIQQSVIQLDGYYLIPRDEIADVNGDNETVSKATAADEVITTNILCKTETCTITVSKLSPNNEHQARLRVENTRRIDVLADHYLSVASEVEQVIAGLYAQKIDGEYTHFSTNEYNTLISTYSSYLRNGATLDMLAQLDNLSEKAKKTSSVKMLFTDILLDIYYGSGDASLLENKEIDFSAPTNKQEKIIHLVNIHAIQMAKKDYASAKETLNQLKEIGLNNAHVNELNAQSLIGQGEYELAIMSLKRAQLIRPKASTAYSLALAHWYKGEHTDALANLAKVLDISPNNYKALKLQGIIGLTMGDTATAITSFQQVIERNNDESTINNLGLAYLLKKDYQSARDYFSRAQQLAPENASFLLNLADAEALIKSDEAINLYKKTLQLVNQNTDRESLLIHAQANAHLNNFVNAADTIQKVMKSNSESIETQYTAALVYALAEDKISAITNAKNALKNGLNVIWFELDWFESLCTHKDFRTLMEEYRSKTCSSNKIH